LIVSRIVQPGDGWLAIARSFEPDAAATDVYAFARRIAAANGETLASALHPDRILWFDDAWVPTATAPPPPPPPPPPPDDDWEALYAARDIAGLDDWYDANTGRRSTATLLDLGGQVTVSQAWLNANDGNGHVRQEAGRWVIENVRCTNFRLVSVNNVTIRNCVVNYTGSAYAIHAPSTAPAHGIIIEDCTINGNNTDSYAVYFPAASYVAHDIVTRRCNISGVQSAVHATRGHTVDTNLIHSLYYFSGSHNTAMSFRGGHGRAIRNRVRPGTTSASGINFYAELGPVYDFLFLTENIVDAPSASATINFPDGDDPSILYSDPFPGMTREAVGNVFKAPARFSNPNHWSVRTGNVFYDGTSV
jgi:hypothetical protein